MEDKAKHPREHNDKARGQEKFETELDRMDYEGGNQGSEGFNKKKNEKEDTDTNKGTPSREQPGGWTAKGHKDRIM